MAFQGANHKHPTWDRLSKIHIPIPSLEKQQEIINYCKHNDKLINQLEKEINENKKISKIFISNIIDNDSNKESNKKLNEELNEELNKELNEKSNEELNEELNEESNKELNEESNEKLNEESNEESK